MNIQDLTPVQIEILEMMACVKSDEMLSELKQAIASHFAKLAQAEVDRLWATGELTEEKIEGFRHLHDRKPYA
ncbi:MAG: dephospho-CoA kinase [Bacteroidales bacterium]|nr:dephospho-CoA kinase [Bacteroidales bacterium]